MEHGRIHRRRGRPDSRNLAGVNPRSITVASRLALAAAVAAITWLATTDRALPELAGLSDKLNHVIAFLALGLLADRSFPQARFGLAKAAALLAYGAAIEAVQHFLPWREASLPDILADAAGIGLYAAARPLFLMIPVFRPPPNG
jgi:VanZ family protein